MSYLVLARKWRPQRFEDLIGQDPIVKVLKNSLEQGKLAHAYVFSGPRGVGKTSSARILAKSLNCKDGPTVTPCGECPSCMAIADSSDVDVIEIDGASNNSVDNIRDLRERVKYAASGGKHKVYIIDEAHMLSTSAFNALLKTLEEPPPHVTFVMATTEARKIPATVMSRCQHLPFRRVSAKAIKSRMKHIVETDAINVTDGALSLVARAADGSIRDSLTLLDQVTSFSDSVDEESVKDLLDIADASTLLSIAGAILRGEREDILRGIEGLVEYGTDLRAFTKDLIRFFRDALVASVVSSTEGLLELSDEEHAAIESLTSEFRDEYITLVLSELIKADADIRTAASARVSLEMWLIKVSYLSTFKDINEAIAGIGGDAAETGNSSDKASAQPRKSPSSPPVKDHYRTKAEISAPPKEKAAPKGKTPPSKPVAPEPSDPTASKAETTKGIASGDNGDDKPHAEPEAGAADEIAPPPEPRKETFFTDETILRAIINRLEQDEKTQLLAIKLAKAKASLSPDTLSLTFSDNDAEICAGPFKKNPKLIESLASELRAIPTRIEIHITHSKKEPASDLKEKVKSEPIVAEALDLFDGRIVHVKKSEDS